MTDSPPPAPGLQAARTIHRGLLTFQVLPVGGLVALYLRGAVPLVTEIAPYASVALAIVLFAIIGLSWFWARARVDERLADPRLMPDPWTDQELFNRAICSGACSTA
jgi:hypothetical protein